MHRSILLHILLLAPVSLAAAQGARESGNFAWLPEPVRVPASEVERACISLPHDVPYVDSPLSTTCRVLRVVSLGRVAEATWSYALYHHTAVYRFPGTSAPDTVTELELVLLAAPLDGEDRLAALGHTRQDGSGIADMSATMAQHPAGLLLGLEFCINGTAGCWQEFMWRAGAEWRELADPRGQLLAELRRTGVLTDSAGARLGAPQVDTGTLEGRATLHDPDDANCCPSRRVEFRLELTDQGWRVRSLAVMNSS
jgi:hypothetical protein